MNFPEKLQNKLNNRIEKNALRKLGETNNLLDFSSNDYLGFAKSEDIFEDTHRFLITNNLKINGATGSRLISGNHSLYKKTENVIAKFHNSESALIYNSGYNANIGFFSSVLQRGDVVLYDEFIHASIRDGIQMANAKAYKFSHNNVAELEKKIIKLIEKDGSNNQNIYVVTESVFSMDGDTPNLIAMTAICKKYKAYFIIDEAHALGVFGENGCGKIQELQLENNVFARIVTFGKALGCHGAVILANEKLIKYLINFSRSFIYTTGLSPHSLATIKMSYKKLNVDIVGELDINIQHFKSEIERLGIKDLFIKSNSAIHCCIISGNENTKRIARKLQEKRFDVKAIISPTVPEGKERLRFCLHNYNTTKEITTLLESLTVLITVS